MSKSVLVVEDELDNLEIMRVILKTAAIPMVEAYDGPSTLAKIEEHAPDLVILDVQIPGMDGFEVTRRIRAVSSGGSIPIFIVTSFAFIDYKAEAYAAGCTEFFSKPFNPRLMLAKIKQYLG